jgi:phenylacetate-CoA ligase
MTFGPWIRRTGFWSLDALRGSPIRHHYEDVVARMAEGPPDTDALERLLEHATRTTPAYDRYAGQPLDAFPVLDKMTLKSDPRSYRSSAYLDAPLHIKKTSGSTGTPMVIGHDVDKRRRTIADTIYFNEAAGQRVGDRLMWLASARLVPIPRSRRLLQNIIQVDRVGLDETRTRALVQRLRRDHVNGVLANPSTLGALARHVERAGGSGGGFGLRVVISIGETLDPGIKQRIAAAFGCPVVDRYGNEENGVLACTRPGGDVLFLNRASYHFEFLKLESDEPAGAGAPARVVITDLYSRATPMIRHDTGDLAVVADPGDAGPAALLSVEGRRSDVIHTTRGGQLSAPSVSAFMVRHFPEIVQYQLVQVGVTRYRLTVALGDAIYHGPDFTSALTALVGPDARIEVSMVERIPSLASGKHRAVFRSPERLA